MWQHRYDLFADCRAFETDFALIGRTLTVLAKEWLLSKHWMCLRDRSNLENMSNFIADS